MCKNVSIGAEGQGLVSVQLEPLCRNDNHLTSVIEVSGSGSQLI